MSRVVLLSMLVALVHGPWIAAAGNEVTITLIRTAVWVGAGSGIGVYINDTHVATLSNGETEIVKVTNLKPGKNSIRLVNYTILGAYPFYENPRAKKGDRKYFVIPNGVSSVTITAGCTQDLTRNVFAVPYEVAEDWDRPKITKIVLNKTLKKVVVKESPPIRLARNTEKTVSDTIRLKHESLVARHWKVDADFKARIIAAWALVDVQIRGEIESITRRTYAEETERTRSVLLRGGDSGVSTKVIWVEYYRTGTATVLMEGRSTNVPFEFRDDFDLLTE